MSEHKFNPLARGSINMKPPNVRDLYGRILVAGDKILLNTPQVPQLYQIASITPAVDPKLPPNTMEIILSAKLRFVAARDNPNPEFVLVIQNDQPVEPAKEPPKPSLVVPDGETVQ